MRYPPDYGRRCRTSSSRKYQPIIKRKEEINILFAAAPSQNEFLAALQKYALPWNRIHALHMDEYIGLQADAPQRFGNYLQRTPYLPHFLQVYTLFIYRRRLTRKHLHPL
ncbi:MAG: hypothetical protein ACLUE2_05295 [Bacteroides cellulosilyticus]